MFVCMDMYGYGWLDCLMDFDVCVCACMVMCVCGQMDGRRDGKERVRELTGMYCSWVTHQNLGKKADRVVNPGTRPKC